MENKQSSGIGLGTISFIVLIVLAILANFTDVNIGWQFLANQLTASSNSLGAIGVILFIILVPIAICLIASIAVLVLGALLMIILALISRR